ncbi:MAG: hypothetical protein HYX55_04770 [Chloroflexi bacterium]|nr:hypothetical protein [Chloroflexota bacterium]
MTRSQRERQPPPDPETPAPDPRTIRVQPRSGDPSMAAAVWTVAALVGLAILKPWGTGSPRTTPAPRPVTSVAAVVTPAPTEDRSADGLAAPICLGTGAWRVATLERWPTQDVRVWRAIEPIQTAGGPTDPSIPSVPIVAVELTGLGWCAPSYGPDVPVGPVTVSAWSVTGGVATELALRQVRPADGTTPIAALYLPLTRCPEPTVCIPLLPAPVPGSWTTSRVVFRWIDGGAGRTAWFAAEIQILPPAPAPSEEVPAGP